jgi:hypothetical protein
MCGPLLDKVLPKTLSDMSEFAQQFRSSLPDILKEATKSGHVKALLETLTPEKKVNRFAGLQFQVREYSGPPLVLGDSLVVFQIEGDRKFKPFFESNDELVAVYLPLSPQQFLVGYNSSLELNPTLLRREIARCSLEHFVASEAPPAHNDLHQLIGENAHLLSISQVETILYKLING